MGGPALQHGPYQLDDDGEPVPLVVAMHHQRDARRLRTLEQHPRVRAVAAVARTFRLDPVAVAEEADPLRRLLRIAAHNIVQAEAAKPR